MENLLIRVDTPIEIYGDQSFATDYNRAFKSGELCAIISAVALLVAANGIVYGATFAGLDLCTNVSHSFCTSMWHSLIGVAVASIIVLGVSEVARKHFSDQCKEKFSKAPQAIEMKSLAPQAREMESGV